MSETTPWIPTACILCECNCGLEVQIEDGQFLRFRGDKAHPASQGYACEKPHRLNHYQNGTERVTHPMRRRSDGTFETIDWDTAIREVSGKLASLRDAHGGRTIFYYGGGGQGNHLPGAYAAATRRALDMRYRSNALAQEKTGEFWVSHEMLGTHTRGDFEHCDVAMFLGKNPWFSHGIPRARVTLREIARDPNRTMIVVDPRRTKTAALADIHLQVRPGTDAWLLAALVGVILQEDLIDHGFVANHTRGLERVVDTLGDVDVATYASWAGVEEALVRRAARAIALAESFASFEDLGVQMNRHSTLVSYLHRLLWLTTGHLGWPGTHHAPTTLLDVASGVLKHTTPVTGAPIIGGLVPCNVIPDEILTEHPERFRAMIVESANPAHSLADSPRFRQALEHLEVLVVIDVAMTETARHADYILPASTQYEKAEATFFNFEFPHNYFHLRKALFAPPEGPLPEAEIHARLCEALGVLEGVPLEILRDAADEGLEAYAMAFISQVAWHPALRPFAPAILYRTLGPALPEGLAEGAVLFGVALMAAATSSESLERAGFSGSVVDVAVDLFRAILESRSGVVFAQDRWEDVLGRLGTPDGKVQLAIPELLEVIPELAQGPQELAAAFPLVLSAGERRAFTANTIFRDDDWRKKDAAGALRIHPEDAAVVGVEAGGRARVVTQRGQVEVSVEVTDSMQRGHISLPNGMGLRSSTAEHGGVALNELTDAGHRDPFAGTPWHKFVPARVESVP